MDSDCKNNDVKIVDRNNPVDGANLDIYLSVERASFIALNLLHLVNKHILKLVPESEIGSDYIDMNLSDDENNIRIRIDQEVK
jgi:hypothetical protein